MSKIIIIGAGAMGTAFAVPCSDNGHEVHVIGTHLEDKLIEKIRIDYIHPSLKTKLPNDINFNYYKDLNTIINSKVDLIVLGISSKGINWICDQFITFFKNKELPDLLILTKGLSIHNNQYELLINKIKRLLEIKKVKIKNISAIAGPCLAAGLANKINSSVVVASSKLDQAQKISNTLNNSYYHTTCSDDIVGVEVCAAIKNIFSMAVGAAKGISSREASDQIKDKNYFNTASALITQSIYEMEIFVEHLKGKKETVKGLSGLGDLYVSSAGGRNALMGSFLGEGLTFSEAKNSKMKEITVEGADLIKEIGKKVKEEFDEKKLPLMIAMINAILEDKKLDIKWNYFTY